MNLESKIAAHVAQVPYSGIRKYFDIAERMKDAVSLGVGEPDFITPWNVRRACITALERGHTQYTSNSGIIELRREINRYLLRRFNVEYNPEEEILVTVGASEAIDLALRAILNPGDEVIVPDPSYVSYMPNISFAHGVPVPVPVKAEDGFRLMPEALSAAITPRTKALILPYPNNPTGGIMQKQHLEAIAKVLKDTEILVISDEIYAELTYEGEHVSFASIEGMKERTVLINGFSKAFAMTGWRLGYLAADRILVDAMRKIHQYVIMCASKMGQMAAVEALASGYENDYADVLRMRQQYDMRRRVIIKGFCDMGLSCFEPLGAFYVFPCIKATGLSSEEFCGRLLESSRVAVVPGTAFGASGEGFVRCSYAYSIEKINEALRRIEPFAKERISAKAK